MVNYCAVCGCCTRTDIVREHLEDNLRICDVSAKGLYHSENILQMKIGWNQSSFMSLVRTGGTPILRSGTYVLSASTTWVRDTLRI
jgi:hypothetical protein